MRIFSAFSLDATEEKKKKYTTYTKQMVRIDKNVALGIF